MSKFSVRILEPSEQSIWDNFIDHTDGGTIFHKYDWLKAAEKHTGYKLLALAVDQGDKMICVFPLFFKKKMFLKTMLSPPNGCAIPHLGPVFSLNTNKQYNAEKALNKIIQSILAFLESNFGYDYLRITCTPEVYDIRQFSWNGFKAKPIYTYRIPLNQQTQSIFSDFDGRVRTGIRNALNNNQINIRQCNKNEIIELLTIVTTRYEAQGKTFKINKEYLIDLIDSDIKEHFEGWAAFNGGQMITGNIVINYKQKVHHWLGGVNPTEKITGVNELLHWQTIKSYSGMNYKEYELIGANTKHLCDHKSKYNPRPIVFFNLEMYSQKGIIALNIYKMLQ